MSAIQSIIKSQHEEIMHRMAEAAKRADRNVGEITLVAVSKVHYLQNQSQLS